MTKTGNYIVEVNTYTENKNYIVAEALYLSFKSVHDYLNIL